MNEEKEYAYVAITHNTQTGRVEEIKLFKDETLADSYVRNRYACVEKMEINK